MCAVCRCATVAANAHAGHAAGEHAPDAETGPRGHAVAELIDEQIPAVIDGEEQFGRARNMHAAEYKMGLRACKPSESRSDDARHVRALCSFTERL